MDELDTLKQRRLLELQKQYTEQRREQEQFETEAHQLEAAIKPLFTRDALARYGTLKTAHPELALQTLLVLAHIKQQKNITSVSDTELRTLLQEINKNKKQTTIIRK